MATPHAHPVRCRVLMVGDVIGKPGRVAVEAILPALREERSIDFVTANGENLAGGMGLTVSTADALFAHGVDVITSGNHIWDKKEIYPALEANDRILRPLNYGTEGVPGRGVGDLPRARRDRARGHQPPGPDLHAADREPVPRGRVRLLEEAGEPLPPVRLVDFHCEITSEKNAMGVHLDGRVSAVVGTHTHVPTADDRILPQGTAYQSDLGCTGRRGRSSGSTRIPCCRGS